MTATSLTFVGATFFGLMSSTVRRTHHTRGRGGGSRLTSSGQSCGITHERRRGVPIRPDGAAPDSSEKLRVDPQK